MNVPQRLKGSSSFTQWLLLGAAALILGSIIGWNIYSEHTRIDAEERARLLTQANVLEQNLGRQLLATNLALDSARRELPLLKKQEDGQTPVNRRLQALSDVMLGVRTFLLLDAEGTALASNREQLIGQNFSGRDYYRVARQGGDPAKLYVSPPIQTVLGVYALTVAKVVQDDQGKFAGVILATLAPDYFKTLLSSVLYSPDMRSTLIHADGKLVFRVPDPQGIVGIDLAARPGAFFIQHMKSGQPTTVAAGIVATSGEARLSVFRTVQPAAVRMDKPLVVVVSREMPALFAPWRKQAYESGGLFLVLMLTATLSLLFYQRRQRDYERLVANQEAERKQTEEDLRRFRVAMDATGDGIYLVDRASMRFVDINSSACSMLELSREEMLTLGPEGVLSMPIEELARIYDSVIAGGSAAAPTEMLRTRTDGKQAWIELRRQAKRSLAGWTIVTVARDITERKLAEADLRVAAAVFESQEGMIVTDARSVILRVNRAFTEITGYTAEEAVGQTPRLLKSGRHQEDFFRLMWETINRTGVWQGEIWDRRKDGEVYPKWLTISAVKGDDGTVTHYIGTQFDISERKKAENKIEQLAFFDQLTGLPNRTLLLDRLKQTMAACSRSGSRGALLFIDLDNFKTLNDTLGHDAGDMLLKQVAQRLTLCVRESDTVARLGGDEFVVVLAGLSKSVADSAAGVETVAEKILASLSENYSLGDAVHRSTASIGVTLFGGDLTSMDDLLKQADLAMYKSKAAGRNVFRFFDRTMEVTVK